jgi:hypothetical protein
MAFFQHRVRFDKSSAVSMDHPSGFETAAVACESLRPPLQTLTSTAFLHDYLM